IMAGYNNHRFLSVFNQSMYEEAKNKDIISEKGFELKDGEYPEVHNQITLRGWKRLTSPRMNVKMLMIKEFFANAARAQRQNPQLIQLRRKELQPLARGWLELIIHNIQPSSNRGGAVPLLRRHQEAEEHNKGPRQEEEGHHEDANHEEEVEIDQEGDEEIQDVEAVYHSPQPQPNMEHESGTSRWMDYEAHYEEQL
ncbi:hypothetical protein PIB30_110263, partial [Stylosanthes scabra]|nr:hypothetical protein [Stylosanthes scabra]